MRLLVAALAALALAAAPTALASEEHPTRDELEFEIMCPDCNAPLADSNGGQARRFRAFIDERIAAGDTKSEIKDRFVEQYGPAILVTPPQVEQPPTLADLEGEVMCPVCNTTLDQSSSPAARQIESFISRRIAAGDSKAQIKDRLVAEYGPQILAAPPKEGFDLLAWLLPFGGLFAGAIALGALAWRWSRAREPSAAADRLDPALERRVDEELARFDES